MLRFARIYLLPGAILQSVIIGGGYGTGRELIQFFTSQGMGNGLLGMMVATALMSAVFALSLKLAIRTAGNLVADIPVSFLCHARRRRNGSGAGEIQNLRLKMRPL